MRKQYFIGHLLTLLTGGLIYILFRSSSLLMFKWYSKLEILNKINVAREYTLQFSNHIPDWILFSLPDGLWIFSYISIMLFIWRNSVSKQNIFWILIVPFLAISSELAQLFGVIVGTFDFIDLLFYILGVVLPFVFFNKLINFKFQTL